MNILILIDYQPHYITLHGSCVKNGERADPLVNCPPGYMELIERCWDQEPTKRPNIEEILQIISTIKQNIITDSLIKPSEWSVALAANGAAQSSSVQPNIRTPSPHLLYV